MVGPGGRPDDAGAPGVVLVGDAAGGAVASGRTPGGRADGLVREGVPDVLRLYPAGTATDLAEPNYRLLTFDDRCTPIATDAPGGHCPRPLVSGMRAKAETNRLPSYSTPYQTPKIPPCRSRPRPPIAIPTVRRSHSRLPLERSEEMTETAENRPLFSFLPNALTDGDPPLGLEPGLPR